MTRSLGTRATLLLCAAIVAGAGVAALLWRRGTEPPRVA
jgi:hypothetical protein